MCFLPIYAASSHLYNGNHITFFLKNYDNTEAEKKDWKLNEWESSESRIVANSKICCKDCEHRDMPTLYRIKF